MLARALRVPRAALVGVCLVGLAGIAIMPWLHQPRPPGFKDRSLVVHWAGAPGMSLPELDRITARASSELRALPEVQDVGANLGRALNADQVVNTNSGEIWVTIKPSADYDQALADVRSVAQTTPGIRATPQTYESGSMSGALSPTGDTVTARVYGQDYPQLLTAAGQVRAAMSRIRGVHNPQLQLGDRQPSLSVEVNIAKAEQHGVKPGDLRREASTLLSGLTVGNFFENQQVFDVVVVGTPAVRASLSSVRNLVLDTVSGGHVRLGDLASISVGAGPADIQHEAISRYVDVIAHVGGRSAASARTAVSGALKTIKFPLEYHAEVQSGSADSGTSHAAFLGYVLAAMVGILLLIQAALGSWSWALVVFLLLPVSLMGGVLVAIATGTAETLAADAGLVAALAIGIRQSLLVAGRIRRAHAGDGGELTDAVVSRGAAEAAGSMLSAAVVLAAALVPFVALGDVAGNELLHVAAAVLLGGVLSATLLNLFVLPAVCLRLGGTRPVVPAETIDDLDWAPPVEVRA
jgi:Cu/Ag efflux pump CusA